MTSTRRLALAKFLKKAKSAKEGGDAVASDVPTVASLPTPPPSASPPPIAAVTLAMASTPAPARPNKGKRVLIVDFDSEDSGTALVSHKRRATGLPAPLAASPGEGALSGTTPLVLHHLHLHQPTRNEKKGLTRFLRSRRCRIRTQLRPRVPPLLYQSLLRLPANPEFPAPSIGS